MKIPLILFVLSALVCAFGYLVPEWSDVLLVGGPAACASAWLIWQARVRQSPKSTIGKKPARVGRKRQAPDIRFAKGPSEDEINAKNWVIVDGSNVMHWINNEPDIQPVRDVLVRLQQHGYTAGVMFDASAGHRLHEKYLHDDTFSRLLGLPEDRIMVVPKGTIADQYILTAARHFRASVVTNDRFRDWVDEFPEVTEHGFLITGWYREGELFTSLGPKPV